MIEDEKDMRKTLKHLCNMVEYISVHQRQISGKIEELASHHEQLFAQQDRIYEQVDALFSIFSLIHIRHPLPTLRGWPVSPDFVKIMMSIIFEKKPSVVLELGSGVSTVVGAYCLEKNGHGALLSMDHDPGASQEGGRHLVRHGLDALARVVCCPLVEQEFSGEKHLWYGIEKLTLPAGIDILVVHGHSVTMQQVARYPALPFFMDRLSQGGVVLVDDAAGPGENEIVKRWMEEYPFFDQEYVDTEKGAVILRKR